MKLDNPQQYVGKKYGNTTILKYIGKYRDNTYKYDCICDCGNKFSIRMREQDKVRSACNKCTEKLIAKKNTKVFFNYYGEKLCLTDLAKKLNIDRANLSNRVYIYKWDMSRWVEPVKRRNK
jgi:hypothetical protein